MKATEAEITDFLANNDTQPARREAVTYTVMRNAKIEIMDEPYVCVTVHVKTRNPNNNLRHWRTHKREADEQKAAVKLAMIGVPQSTWDYLAQGCEVTMTRMSSGHLGEFDALPASLKHCRDQIAQLLFGGAIGERDEDPRATWIAKQIRVPVRTYGLIICIKRRPNGGE